MSKLDAMKAFELAAKGELPPDPTAQSELEALCAVAGGEVFRSRVEVKMVSPELDTPCFVWKGALTSAGYAAVKRTGEVWLVHRLSYRLIKGPIPPGLVVRHLCHNKTCIRPSHLAIGTQADNLADSAERAEFERQMDKDIGSVELTAIDETNIRTARRNGVSASALAEEYGVTPGTIRKIEA